MEQRTIKFRFWMKKEKKMWYSDRPEYRGQFSLVFFTDKLPSLSHYQAEVEKIDCWASKDFILMQFTGLLDKNGKEIYEGDIVKWNKKLWRATWYSSGFWFMVLPDGHQDVSEDILAIDNRTIKGEIIGNIYENKNLLKKQGE